MAGVEDESTRSGCALRVNRTRLFWELSRERIPQGKVKYGFSEESSGQMRQEALGCVNPQCKQLRPGIELAAILVVWVGMPFSPRVRSHAELYVGSGVRISVREQPIANGGHIAKLPPRRTPQLDSRWTASMHHTLATSGLGRPGHGRRCEPFHRDGVSLYAKQVCARYITF